MIFVSYRKWRLNTVQTLTLGYARRGLYGLRRGDSVSGWLAADIGLCQAITLAGVFD